MSIWVDANGWPVPPAVLLGCLVAEILYFRGWRVLVKAEQARRFAAARAAQSTRATARVAPTDTSEFHWDSWLWRGAYFLGGVVTFLIASSAPIDILSGRFFWVHMVQHLLLLVVIAPLLVAGAPLLPLWLGLPRRARGFVKAAAKPPVWHVLYRVGQWLQQPASSCVLLIIGMWVWHWPALYDLALRNGAIHDWCEHVTFLAVSFLFWAQMIPSPPLHPRLGYLGRMGIVGIAIAQNVVLAVLLGFAPVPLYAPYVHLAATQGGLPALQDQQLGAGIMWTIGDVPFVIAIFILMQQWLASQLDDTSIAIKSHHNAER